MKKVLYWTEFDYIKAIQIIKSNCDKEIVGCDSDTIGDKYNECSIGLCSQDFKDRKLFPPYRNKHHLCPLDMRQDLTYSSGCFYDCAYFKPKKNKSNQTCKELVLAFKLN